MRSPVNGADMSWRTKKQRRRTRLTRRERRADYRFAGRAINGPENRWMVDPVEVPDPVKVAEAVKMVAAGEAEKCPETITAKSICT